MLRLLVTINYAHGGFGQLREASVPHRGRGDEIGFQGEFSYHSRRSLARRVLEAAYICDAIRTPFGRYGGALAAVRADDLAAVPIAALLQRNAQVDWSALDDVVYGCANQAGEDNRNVGRMALLLAGLPKEVSGSTVNRLCASSMDAVASAARAIKSGEAELMIAGGVESMSRAPFVVAKADTPFSRAMKM